MTDTWRSPAPVFTRHADGIITVEWNTPDGQPPSTVLCASELLIVMIDQHNATVRKGQP